MGTTVIFRKEKCKNGDIIAIFPYEMADLQGNYTGYAHVGQHHAVSPIYYTEKTKPAKPEEYKDLLYELENLMGYDDLEIKQKVNHDKWREAHKNMG